MGMSLNEKKEFTLKPEEADGLRDENHVRAFPCTELPAGLEPKVGDNVALSTH
jgi:peptidylprolyl isomerase